MNKTMFAAILSITLLMVGVIATAYDLGQTAYAEKSRGKHLKDVSAKPSRHRAYSQVCGDHLCKGINDASAGLRAGEISRGFPR